MRTSVTEGVSGRYLDQPGHPDYIAELGTYTTTAQFDAAGRAMQREQRDIHGQEVHVLSLTGTYLDRAYLPAPPPSARPPMVLAADLPLC